MMERVFWFLFLASLASAALAQTGQPVGPNPPAGLFSTTGALKGNGSGTISQAACADLSNGGGACSQGYTATTWTPTVTTDGTVGTPAYTVQVGSYEQIGRLVIARFNIELSGWTGSPTGNVSLASLPVTSTATTSDLGYCTISQFSTSTSYASMGAFISTSSTTGVLRAVAAGGGTSGAAVTAAGFGTTGQLFGTCIYHN